MGKGVIDICINCIYYCDYPACPPKKEDVIYSDPTNLLDATIISCKQYMEKKVPERKVVLEDSYTMEDIFTYHAPREHDILVYQNLREMAKRFGIFIIEHCPDCHDRDEAIDKLREVIMWTNSSIALRQDKNKI